MAVEWAMYLEFTCVRRDEGYMVLNGSKSENESLDAKTIQWQNA